VSARPTPIAVERLIGEVAKRHDILLSRDDPVLVTVTMNELLLAEMLGQLHTSLDEAKLEIASASAKQIEASKTIAEQLITAAADYVTGELRAAAAEIRDMPPGHTAQTSETDSHASSLAWLAAIIAITAACLSGALVLAAPFFMETTAPAARCHSSE
jgi:hypothetical protein